MKLYGIAIDPSTNSPIVILQGIDIECIIPIWIGMFEAASITSGIQNISFNRPLTHDLIKNLLDYLHIKVSKIEITDIQDNTYYSRIYFNSQDYTFSMDSRPSDAIAIAIRYQAPILVEDRVIKLSKNLINGTHVEGDIMDQSEEGKKWAEYLTQLDPEEFGKYKI